MVHAHVVKTRLFLARTIVLAMLACAPDALVRDRCAAQATSALRLDPGSLCSASTGLPALSRSANRVAYLRCRSSFSDASDVQLVIADTRGRVLQRSELARCGEGCSDWPSPEVIGRRIARAERALARGGFAPMQQADGFGEPGSGPAEGPVRGAGRVIHLDGAAGVLRLGDASGAELARVRVAGTRAPRHCCTAEDGSLPCTLPPQLANAWIDASGRVVVAQIITGYGIDACEGGPDFVVLRAP
jgi:hypothetical protein